MAVRTKRGNGAAGTETVYIKNMVCDRCIRVVREELNGIGLDVRRVELGEAEVRASNGAVDRARLRDVLAANGFELIVDGNGRLIEAVKKAVIALVRRDRSDVRDRRNYPKHIAASVGKEYHSLSALFSSVENITIEQYFIRQRIERVKELMFYGERTLSEIAYELDYSSVQHLSNQFRAVTGMTPTAFRAMNGERSGRNRRRPLDKVR